MISAVVFDCDGVLVDSEPIADEVWALVLAESGYTMTNEDAVACLGTSEPTTYAYYAKRANVLPYEEHMAAIDEIRIPVYEERLRAFPDAYDTVRSLAAQGIPMAVASSSRRPDLDGKLAITDLARYFEAFVGGDEVEHGKPAPDVYLEAARRLGIPPSECIAIEDAEHGATAAAAAGMRAVMVKRDGSISPNHATVSEITADLITAWMWRF
ncbi:MAG: HAD family phosphatase [Actinomycetota bacterium]|nr:HAD family phosphatase [Actinomycetota bacterium]